MAWPSFFPTEVEKWLWRVCSLLVAAGCTPACLVLVCVGVVRNSTNEDRLFAGIEGKLIVMNSIVYIYARFILLVLPWIQLRGGSSVDTSVWKNLDWPNFSITLVDLKSFYIPLVYDGSCVTELYIITTMP